MIFIPRIWSWCRLQKIERCERTPTCASKRVVLSETQRGNTLGGFLLLQVRLWSLETFEQLPSPPPCAVSSTHTCFLDNGDRIVSMGPNFVKVRHRWCLCWRYRTLRMHDHCLPLFAFSITGMDCQPRCASRTRLCCIPRLVFRVGFVAQAWDEGFCTADADVPRRNKGTTGICCGMGRSTKGEAFVE